MKFATLALLASSASATVITVDDDAVGSFIGNLQESAFKAQQGLLRLGEQTQAELDPYIYQLQ